MGRHKLKYRDVVGGGNRKNSKNKKNFNQKKGGANSNNKKKQKQDRGGFNKKRKFTGKSSDGDGKRQRIEEEKPIVKPVVEEPVSSSSSESDPDEWEKFMSWGDSKYSEKRRNAIDTSEDSDSELEHDEKPEEKLVENVEEQSESGDEDVEEQNDEDEKDEMVDDEDETKLDDSNDPFIKHILYDLHENLLKSLQNSSDYKVEELIYPTLGRLVVRIPKCDEIKEEEKQGLLDEKKHYAPLGTVPKRLSSKFAKPAELFIKTQIVGNLIKANPAISDDSNLIFTDFQAELFSIINNYQDLLFNERTFENADEIRFIYCLHAVNHVLKTRLKVIHHNARLTNEDDVPDEFRDQGLVRPKVLIVVPYRDSAYKIIKTIINILLPEDKGNVINKKRFITEFTGNELYMPKKHPKPDDYVATFTGNTGDDFRIGMSVTKKSLKLFADFYSSDILVASPLGLRTIIGAEGESTRDYDFLASIELLILDQTDLFITQNWDHVFHLFKHMHLQPKSLHGTNLQRVRTWALDGHAKYYRQTLIFSSVMMAGINNIFNRGQNYAGKVKVENEVKAGSINEIVVKLPHVFQRFETNSLQESSADRLEFFMNKILPNCTDTVSKQTLIFVPSYFDFVRLRNRFNKDDVSFVQICEYTQEKKVARARDMFFHGDAHFLLYTERFHFFNRIRVKGIRHIIFYQPPNFPHFYSEMCNLMTRENMNKRIGHDIYMTVTVLYCKYDIFQMYGIVGTSKTNEMLSSDQNSHAMVTGDK